MTMYGEDTLDLIKMALNKREEEYLSPLAVVSSKCVRREYEEGRDLSYRQDFSIDIDRILNSLAYTRYIDKTQVFYLIKNDHITHRVLHVQLVSKVARTIGRFLGLNEDLIEAISLGHDIGHTPFGHDGEKFLSQLCVESGIGHFLHNVQSVWFLDKVERKGKGWNLSLQTLDGILSHDGEIHNQSLAPQRKKDFDTLEKEITLKKTNPDTKLVPMTLEGCVVRIADTISYIGRDIEDAIRLNIIKRADLPKEIIGILGDTNGTITYNLVTDVIKSSFQTTCIAFSSEVSEALRQMKKFNMERIYLNPVIKKHLNQIKTLFNMLFEKYLTDIEKENRQSVIYTSFLEDMSKDYMDNQKNEEIVRDFIAGMTDRYFLQQCPEDMRPVPEIKQ